MRVFDNCGDGYGARLVVFLRVLDAVENGVSGGEARGQGVVSVERARGRAPSVTGVHGGDMGAVCTGVSRWHLHRGRHGEGRCSRGVLVDKLGRLGAFYGARRERGGKGSGSALFGLNGVVDWGTRGQRFRLQKREGGVRATRGWSVATLTVGHSAALSPSSPAPAGCSTEGSKETQFQIFE